MWGPLCRQCDGGEEHDPQICPLAPAGHKLESLGATVTLTRTGIPHLASDNHDDLVARADMARTTARISLSAYMDGSTSSTANGSSVHYFNEYSYEASVKVRRADAGGI